MMDDKIKQIKKDGYLIIKNLLNDEEISKLEKSHLKKRVTQKMITLKLMIILFGNI